ncbi:MAG: hypothetical protein HQK54_01825 [Oligoflexales bacterium]|nr:hypothetical protein [Oligoflexales bacterium]
MNEFDTSATVIPFHSASSIRDRNRLTDVIRKGARKMLQAAIEFHDSD